MAPRRGRYLASTQTSSAGAQGSNSTSTDVARRSYLEESIIDNTAQQALRTLGSGMMSGLTSQARPWFRLGVSDPEMNEDGSVKSWLHVVETRMREVMSRSNFYNVLHTTYTELGGFGSAPIVVLEDPEDVIRLYQFTVGTYYLAQNERLTVDTLYRETTMTVGQCVARFGYRNCSNAIKNLWGKNQLDAIVNVIHFIEPNVNRDISMADNRNMPFMSGWYEASGEGDMMLRVSGFPEQPMMAPRWDVFGEDTYGNACGHIALGDTKALQIQQRRKAQAIDKHVDPPMRANPSLRKQRSSLLPGDVTYVDAAGQSAGFEPAYVIKPEIQALLLDIQDTRERISRAFYEDLFLMLAQSDRRQITAREIEERHEEKLLMLGPVVERLNNELLNPLIDRIFYIMERNGMFPDAPEIMQGVPLKVEYISVLAQAQKLVGIGAIDRFSGYVGQVAQFVPEALDKFDADQAIDDYAEATGVPPGLVRPDDVVEEIRTSRQQAQAAQMLIESAPNLKQAADAGKSMAETPVKGQSALDRMAESVSE